MECQWSMFGITSFYYECLEVLYYEEKKLVPGRMVVQFYPSSCHRLAIWKIMFVLLSFPYLELDLYSLSWYRHQEISLVAYKHREETDLLLF